MSGRLQVRSFGPMVKGVLDQANPSATELVRGAAKRLVGFRFIGGHKLAVRPGTVVKMYLLLPGGTGLVTSACALEPWADWALAVGHSTTTNATYLYRLEADLSGWYDSTGAFHANQNAEPVGTLWSSCPDPPDVTIAEGLGLAYIAHGQALDATTLGFATKTYAVPGTIATLTGALGAAGATCDIYFRGVVSYNQHLWGWGFGSGTTAADAFRPELARFSLPNFAGFQLADSITVGDRVRSQREQVVGGKVAGEALFLGSPFILTRVTGYGRSSWFKKPLDKTFGFPGAKCATVRGDTLYYWSSVGPMRCLDAGQPEQLRLPVELAVSLAINPETVCAGFDDERDLVLFFYDAGTTSAQGPGVRTWMAYDPKRELFVGPDDDIGMVIRYVSTVSPVFASAAAHLGSTEIGKPAGPPVDPSGAPSAFSTTDVTHTSAVAHWTNADPTASTRIELRRQGDTTWIGQAVLEPGVVQYMLSSLVAGVGYEWRAAHVRGGVVGSFAGPSTDTQFTTIAQSGSELAPPVSGPILDLAIFGGFDRILISWSNASPDVGTEVWITPDVQPGPPVDGDFSLVYTAPFLVSTAFRDEFSSGLYWVKLRHVKDGFSPSPFTDPVPITVVVTGSVE